jgi:hypothetical protein
MEVWQLVLYGAASALALRSLIGLMAGHKVWYGQKRIAEISAQRRRARAKRKAAGADTSAQGERVA